MATRYVARNYVGGDKYIIHGSFATQREAEDVLIHNGTVIAYNDESTILAMRHDDTIFHLGDTVKIKKEFQRDGESDKKFVVDIINELTLRAIVHDIDDETNEESVQLNMLRAVYKEPKRMKSKNNDRSR